MEVSEIISSHRKGKNMTQDELGKKLFLSKQTISKWENGRSVPDIETMKKLVDILDIEPSEIFVTDSCEESEQHLKKRCNFKKLIVVSVCIITVFLVTVFVAYNLFVSDITIGIGKPVLPENNQYFETVIVGTSGNNSNEKEIAYMDQISNLTYECIQDVAKLKNGGCKYEIKAHITVKNFKTTVKYEGNIIDSDGQLIDYHKEITLDFVPRSYDKTE